MKLTKRTKWLKTSAAWLLALACALTPSLSIQAQEAEALTLPLAVELALRTNPLTRATASGRELADAQVAEARAGRLPQVQLSESFANGNNPVFVFGSLLEQARFTQQNFNLPLLNNPDPLTNFRFGVTVKAPLFDGRQTATRVERAQLGQKQADARTVQVEQQIRFETLRAFYGLLLAEAKKEVAAEAVKLAEADVKLSRDRVEAGTSVVSDLLAA
ncbi:MAG TPA: TolC family protein, partial [Blastocatellia bacterium]|nr:TolC family protein [Blastocatellia bacterium]